MADNPQSQAAPEPTPEPTPAPTPAPAAAFSQADVDRIVQERLARDRRDRVSDDELAQLRDKATKFDEIEAQSKSDLEKANERIAALERQSEDSARAAQDERLRSAIVSEAAKRNVRDPDAAVALIDRAVIEFDDDGFPTNIAKAMDSLLETRDYLIAPQGGTRAGSADQGARPGNASGQLTREDLQRLTREGKTAEIVKAQEEGRLADVLGGSQT